MRSLPSGWNTVLAKLGFKRSKKRVHQNRSLRRLRFEALEDRKMLAVFTVNTHLDEADGINVGGVSLREAVIEAGPSGDTINFDPTTMNGVTINLLSNLGQMLIQDKSLTIDANMLSNGITIDAGHQGFRIFNIIDTSGGSNTPLVTLKGLTLTGGDVSGDGGAINSTARLAIIDSVFEDNAATFRGGAINLQVARVTGSATTREVLRLDNTTVDGNSAVGDGGGVRVIISSTTTDITDAIVITGNTTIANNSTESRGGGAFIQLGRNSMLEIDQSLVQNNEANQGGGMFLDATQSTVQIENSVFDLNTAFNRGGGIAAELRSNTMVRIEDSMFGLNTAFSRGGGISAELSSNTTMEILNSILSENQLDPLVSGNGVGGGGIHSEVNGNSSFAIVESEITGNSAYDGGGVYVDLRSANAEFTMERSLVQGNHARNRGGGVYLYSPAGGRSTIEDSIITGNDTGLMISGNHGDNRNSGGGVYAFLHSNDFASATLTISGTTVDNNSAGEHGGGIFICTKRNGVTLDYVSEVGIYNSTISGNTAGLLDNPKTAPIGDVVDGDGGGVHIAMYSGPANPLQGISARFTNVTITENTATGKGGGIWSIVPPQPGSINDTRLNNTIASGNTVLSGLDADGNNLWGSFNVDESYNNLLGDDVVGDDPDGLIWYPTGADGAFFTGTLGNGNIYNATNDPLLGALAYYGGLTRTHVPLQNSPAIDAGRDDKAVIPFTTMPLMTDQRGAGYPRMVSTVDIGAHEKQIALPTIVDVILSGSDPGWTRAPFAFSSIIAEGEQLRPIATQGIDTITIIFSESVNVTATDFDLKGLMGTTVPYDGFSHVSGSNVATWTFDDPLEDDKYAIHLSTTIVDLDSGNLLDGDWHNPDYGTPDHWLDDVLDEDYSATFVTGDGVAGSMAGVFRFHFALLAGDSDGDGIVEADPMMDPNKIDDIAPGVLGDIDGDGTAGTAADQTLAENMHDNKLRLRAVDDADFDDDEIVNAIDLARWEANYGKNVVVERADGDANGDGKVNTIDLALWEQQYGGSPDPVFSADFNDDGSVDGLDFLVWQANQGLGYGDADGDDWATGLDFLIWQYSFGLKSAWYVDWEMGAGVFPLGVDAPQVTNVIISGSLSTHDPFSFDTVDGSGSQLATVPVGLADTISIVFSENVNVAATSLVVVGLTTANRPELAEFNYDPLTYTAVWRYEGWALGDNYLVSLTDAVTDVDGNLLDGEWINPASINTSNALVSEFPSGDGEPGGAFNFVMTLLAGDANLDGVVNSVDYSIWSSNAYSGQGMMLFTQGDFNGDGAVDSADVVFLYETFNTNLQDLFILADLNGDFDVDDGDLMVLNNNFGMTGATYEDGDLNGDGTVDDEDLDLAFAQFGLRIDLAA